MKSGAGIVWVLAMTVSVIVSVAAQADVRAGYSLTEVVGVDRVDDGNILLYVLQYDFTRSTAPGSPTTRTGPVLSYYMEKNVVGRSPWDPVYSVYGEAPIRCLSGSGPGNRVSGACSVQGNLTANGSITAVTLTFQLQAVGSEVDKISLGSSRMRRDTYKSNSFTFVATVTDQAGNVIVSFRADELVFVRDMGLSRPCPSGVTLPWCPPL